VATNRTRQQIGPHPRVTSGPLSELGEYSTIRLETKKECNQDDFDIFEQFINPTLAKRISEEQLCHDIESCESEVIDSGPPSLASPTRK
jgi:hypothetical protein